MIPDVTFTKHARKRMLKRRVTEPQVLLTLRRPSAMSRLFDEPGKWAFRRRIGRRYLTVIAFRRDKGFKVKTAYWS